MNAKDKDHILTFNYLRENSRLEKLQVFHGDEAADKKILIVTDPGSEDTLLKRKEVLVSAFKITFVVKVLQN